jgi:hypothetical protein
LLLKASPLDTLTIRELIKKHLDGGTDSLVVVKTHPPIRLENMYVTDAYYILRDIFRESMDNNVRGGGLGGGFASILTGETRTPVLNIDAHGNPKGVTLNMSYDNNTNSLIVACPQAMYDDIKKLVGQMDAAAAEHKQTVKFVRLPGVDPAVVQQALEAIQGRSSMNRANNGMNGPGGMGNRGGMNGGNGMGGFGAGGFGGGGFGGGAFPGGGFFPGGGGVNNSTFTPGPGGFGGAGGFGAGGIGGKGPS